MKKLALPFLLVAAFVAPSCGGANAASSAAGLYELDKTAFKDAMMAQMPEEARKEPKAAEMMQGMVDGMVASVELKVDGTLASKMKMSAMGMNIEDNATGTWKLDGNKLTVTTKSDKTGKEDTRTVDYQDGAFAIEEMQGGQKMTMTFKRK